MFTRPGNHHEISQVATAVICRLDRQAAKATKADLDLVDLVGILGVPKVRLWLLDKTMIDSDRYLRFVNLM